jgi:hypothetical protein
MREHVASGSFPAIAAQGSARTIRMPRREVASMAKEETKKDIKKGEKEK